MRAHVPLTVVVCLLFLGTGGTGGVGAGALAQEAGVNITDVAYSGPSAIDMSADRLHLWQDGPHEFAVTIRSDQQVSAELCLHAAKNGDVSTLTCQRVSLAPGSESVSVAVADWPENLTGEQTLVVRLSDPDSGQARSTRELAVTLLRRSGDLDGDGLTNQREVELGTDIAVADTDDDGLDDRVEVEIYGTAPLEPDSDADGLIDGEEVTTHRTDPRSTDTDGDGLADGTELDRHGTNPNKVDTDGDRLSDSAEVNTYQTDPTNADTDGDGLGDGAEVQDLGTDPTGVDTDGDGLSDGQEQNVYLTDPTTADTDGDGLGDAAEVEDYQTDPTAVDTDGDSLDDDAEVNTHGTDPNAVDTDSDGLTDGAELRRGTDPTQPTATTGGPFEVLVGLIARRPALVVGLVLAIAAGIAVVGYWAGVRPSGLSLPAPLAGRVGTAESSMSADLDDAGPTAEPTDDVTPSDTSVLTNEERVHRLLDSNGGRMLQSDVVDAADWSKATVSRVLTRMEEEGAISRIDIGKGNLVTRPEDEPRNR